MGDRITKANLETRCENLNRRMESRGSLYRYEVEYRYDYCALDRYIGTACQSTVRCGTKREVADFLHAMMVALDDAAYKRDEVTA